MKMKMPMTTTLEERPRLNCRSTTMTSTSNRRVSNQDRGNDACDSGGPETRRRSPDSWTPPGRGRRRRETLDYRRRRH